MLTRRGFIRSLISAGMVMGYGRTVFAEKKEPTLMVPRQKKVYKNLPEESVIPNIHLSEDEIKLNRFFSTYKNEVSAIVKIKEISCRTYSADYDKSTLQVDVECLAMDSSLDPFNLDLVYSSDTEAEAHSLLRDLKVGTISCIMGGDYHIFDAKSLLAMYDPEYRLIEPEFIEVARELFLLSERNRQTV